MPQFLFDSDDPAVLMDPMFNDSRVATYADLLTPEIVAHFGARLAVIDRGHGDPLNKAHIVDCESGADTLQQSADKLHQWTAEGRPYVTAYANRSTQPQLKALLGTLEPFWWVATLDGTMNVGDNYTALVQFAGEAAIGKHVDVSIVYHTGWLEFTHLTDLGTVNGLVSGIGSLLQTANGLAALARGL